MKRLTRPVLLAVLLGMLAIPGQRAAAQAPSTPQYRPVVLPTLGGPSNYWENPGPIFNIRGMVALFGSDINAPDPHPDACFNPDCYLDHAAIWQDGKLVDLGAFPGPTSSAVGGISPNGRFAAGLSTDGTIDPVSALPVYRAALFTGGKVTDLGTLGGPFSAGNDVNDRGQVVGFAETGAPDSYSGQLGGNVNQPGPDGNPGSLQLRAFLWEGGTMHDLGTLGGNDAEAYMINASGQITGASFTTTTANTTTGMPTQHPFLWNTGKMLDLGTLGGTWGLPTDLNDAGQVVGTMNLAGDQTHHAFLWKQGKLTDLATLGGVGSDALWENAAGDVVGRADLPNTGPACNAGGPLGSDRCPHHAVMWKNGTIVDLGTPTGQTCNSTASSVNDVDQVVGAIGGCSRGGNGFLWENGTMYLGSDLIPPQPSGLKVEDTFYINDRGEIFGIGILPNGEEQAIVLEPAHRNTAAAASVSPSGNGASASFTAWFDSSAPGQGAILFGSGPGCSGLVETATQDQGAGTTSHMVQVRGNDLPGTVGDNGIQPGATYWYEAVTVTRTGTEIDTNAGKCYSLTVPAM